MKTCLLITEQFEPTADVLLAELRKRGVPCLRWNLDRYPSDSSLTFRVSGDGMDIDIKSDGRRVRVSDVASIWSRGFRPTGIPDSLAEADRVFAQTEAQRAIDALLTLGPPVWINHPQCNARANSKPAQLALASATGFHIPETIISNDPEEIRTFLTATSGPHVFKALSQTLDLAPGKALYTGLIGKEEAKTLDFIRLTPGIFQRLVAKDYELRITVVGTSIFAGRINSQVNSETEIDWRHRPFDIENEPADIPIAISDGILSMMRTFGLIYGAFDFIVTPEGRYVFLEVNPAGQYLWVETQTGMPITSALANELSAPCET